MPKLPNLLTIPGGQKIRAREDTESDDEPDNKGGKMTEEEEEEWKEKIYWDHKMIRWYKRKFQAHVVLHARLDTQIGLEIGLPKKFDISRNHLFVYPVNAQWIVEEGKVQCPEHTHGYYYLDDAPIPWQCMHFKDTPVTEEDISNYTTYDPERTRTLIPKTKWDLQAVHPRIYD
ncbi:uncharacterized protein LAESUDRAFT_760784 [Laetiporus sulphureus 93-53]|uniref:Uncharacterized protein n=1 Tax=Laetiporus sulphureus 93-53 TaxID=1314785 RepID=A0A165DF38_9APHY|nr:uncharacterized protein LAESUDRAFT_760784 [Laetiporus sulphureus 93-53]KZT04752.1 hypothetical protein LAESUDRAFT_760784 [Laetiporus sulphureus 93-53]